MIPDSSESSREAGGSAATSRDALRDEIAELGEMLGRMIEKVAGSDALRTVELIRQLSRNRRAGDYDADRDLLQVLAALDEDQLRIVVRAFTVFLDLANVAEDRQRVRVLRNRARKASPRPSGESIEDALWRLKDAGKSAVAVQTLLDRLAIELVFTAHPTESKRRSVRRKLRRIRELLDEPSDDWLPVERARNRRRLEAELAKLWLTDFYRPWRPTVLQEVQRGLSIEPVLWDVVPQILCDVRAALAKVFPEHTFHVGPCIGFGSWIGGDRDGHPDVTTEITRQTIVWLRQAALEFHLAACRELFASLSLSARQMNLSGDFIDAIEAAVDRWPPLGDELREIPPNEVFRRWVAVIEWRLKRTQEVGLEGLAVDGAYETADALEADARRLHDALILGGHDDLLADDAAVWLDRVRIFGLHLARLDVRQDSRRYLEVMNELLDASGTTADAASLSESDRLELLAATISKPLQLDAKSLSEEARETLSLFRLLRRVVRAFGPRALGGHVISMTRSPVDVLAVLWLWQHAEGEPRAGARPLAPLPIIPLFETIEDLREAPRIFAAILKVEAYREHLRRLDDRQTVMLGYSDSTKDGGYLSACWSLYRCQQLLHDIAASHDIELTFFHGRGGALGRGGGPAARAILSLPASTFHGSLRMTEQGEVLADRYDDARIAHRHLEQVTWSSLLASGLPPSCPPDDWHQTMAHLAEESFSAYRGLVQQPGFVDFFRRATPISEVERLPIGSRPAKRRGGGSLKDLRAIPWVFSWTQARCLLPAWFGLGHATESALADAQLLDRLRTMYRQWPFFQATIDNAELALAKTDLGIAELYARLADDSAALATIGEMISAEFSRAKRAVLAITTSEQLLDGTPWLQESIRVRNRYIDPLNLIQVELLRRLNQLPPDAAAAEQQELRHLMRLTINGVAAGMRSTG